MMKSDFIVDVSEEDFEYQVLAFSQETPVVVEFWATWCAPCRVLGPLLEKLAIEAQGGFRLAKVNVDENPNLARRYAVRSIPAVKAFHEGRQVSEFVGALPEPKVREFIRALVPGEDELMLEKGSSLLSLGRAGEAEDAFREVLAHEPDQPAALLGLVVSLLRQGETAESRLILKNFPASREYVKAELLLPLSDALVEQARRTGGEDEEPLDAAFGNAMRLVLRGNIEAALDGLLDILRQDKRYRNGKARQVFLALLELLGEGSEPARQYRNELSMVLF